MRTPGRNQNGKNRVKRGATPSRTPRQPFSLAPYWTQVQALPWRLIGLAVLVPSLLVLVVQSLSLAWQHFDRNIGQIEISGEFENLTRETLYRELVYLTEESFFLVDLKEAQAKIESLPWVESSQVARVWPNRLHFTVKEHQPIALWGTTQLLSHTGELFEPEDRSRYSHLPQLQGPQGSQGSLWQNYVRWSQELNLLGMKVSGISLAARGAWELELEQGVVIKLGREDLQGKMDRLRKIFRAELRDKLPEIEILDARYANGLAVRWKAQANNG